MTDEIGYSLAALSSFGAGRLFKARARTTIVKDGPITECTHIAIHRGQDGLGVKKPVVLASIIAKLSRKIESTSGDDVMSKYPLL